MTLSIERLIGQYGGKAASLLAQYYAGNLDMILPFTLIDLAVHPLQIPDSGFKGKQILRLSANGDEKGLVNVLPTNHNVRNRDLNNQIWDLVTLSESDEVQNYARWEGLKEYKRAQSGIIQPQNLNIAIGSIVEHPNIPGHYVIDIRRNPRERATYQALVNEQGDIVVETAHEMVMPGIDKGLIKHIVEMKKRSRKAGFIPQSYSSQVEFGFLRKGQDFETGKYQYETSPSFPVLFYQERQFLPFLDTGIAPQEYGFNKFGVVPNKELRVIKIDEFVIRNMREYPKDDSGGTDIDRIMKMTEDGHPSLYAFTPEALGEDMLLTFQPNNLVGFVVTEYEAHVARGFANALHHNTFRWAQKAEFSLLQTQLARHLGEYFVYGSSFNTGRIIQLRP